MGQTKYDKLIESLKGMGSLVVAFSGGVDSTLLLKAAKDALGDKVIALTVVAPYHMGWETDEAQQLAEELNVTQEILREETIMPEIRDNPPDRCYLCKKALFSRILQFARQNGFEYVADGTNADDTNDYRPGMRALKELGIRSPLLETGLTKEEIRRLSKEMNLPTWDKPAYACLLSRIPYGKRTEIDDLRRIERAEKYLMDAGFRNIRVRLHDRLARIEVTPEERTRFFDLKLLDKVSDDLKAFGFHYVTLDLQGYRMGSLNEVLDDKQAK